MLPNAGNNLSLIDCIYLPCLRGETPVAFPGPLAGPFLVPNLMTLVSTAVVQMYEGLTIQALDFIRAVEQGAGPGVRLPWEFTFTLLLPRQFSINARALIVGLFPCS